MASETKTQRAVRRVCKTMPLQFAGSQFYVEGTEFSLRRRLEDNGVEYAEEDIQFGVEIMRRRANRSRR